MNSSGETAADQREHEFATLGYYEPGFIHLRINTHDDLKELNKITEPDSSPLWTPTFLHEYIHFLQDITTTHGLLNFLHAVEHLKNANKKVLDATATYFSIPLNLDNDFNWQTNRRLKATYRGRVTPWGNRVPNINYLGYSFTNEQIPVNGGEIIKVPKYQIQYYDTSAQSKSECHFGSIHIKEYMAHAVQNQFAPGTTHDDLPYLVAELIVKKEVPSLGSNPSLVIALCDASLMDFHPARLFFDAIERMKNNSSQIPTDVDSIYSFVFNGLKFQANGVTQTVKTCYEETSKLAVDAFQSTLKAAIFKHNVQWFDELMVQAGNFRQNEQGFFSRLVTAPGMLSSTFRRIVTLLGVPFTTNAEFKGIFVPPERLKGLAIQPYFPKVFQAVSNTYGGNYRCSLHPFCETSPVLNLTNEDCLTQPWRRVHLPELCPYAQMWKTWGLQKKLPKPSAE